MSVNTPQDEFFVGWLQTPRSYVRFLNPMVFTLLFLGVITAGTLAFFQRNPGAGHWEDDKVVVLRGVAFAKPYAMLRVPGDQPNDPPRTFLLVEDGKFGALPRVSKIVEGRPEGVPVEVQGTVLHRGDRWMLALSPGDSGMRPLTESQAKELPFLGWALPRTLADSITLRGEIIDPKCYLGAMKPGGGKTHKACAMRCIAGGIPPMLVTRTGDGHETFYLLVMPDGSAANEALFPFVGDQVEMTGRLEQQNDLLVFQPFVSSIRRR